MATRLSGNISRDRAGALAKTPMEGRQVLCPEVGLLKPSLKKKKENDTSAANGHSMEHNQRRRNGVGCMICI